MGAAKAAEVPLRLGMLLRDEDASDRAVGFVGVECKGGALDLGNGNAEG